MDNPNENNLEGLQCPKCQSYGPFRICAEVFVTVTDEGITEYGDSEWGNDSHCFCDCGHNATVEGFHDE